MKKFLILISLLVILLSNLSADKPKVRIDKKYIETFLTKYYNICKNAKDDEVTGSYDEKSIEEMAKLFEYDINYADEVITACKNSILPYKNIKGELKVVSISYNDIDDFYVVRYTYLKARTWEKELVFLQDSNGKMDWFFRKI